MTVSIKAFEKVSKGVRTLASWNTDGSVSITQQPAQKPTFSSNREEIGWDIENRKYVRLIPSLLREIATRAIKTRKKGGEPPLLLVKDLLMPGLFPYPATVRAHILGNMVEISEESHRQGLPIRTVAVFVPVGQLRLMLNRCIGKMRRFDKTCGIRPLFGGIIRKDTTKKL